MDIHAGDVVTVTEYELSQLSGRRRIRSRLENVIVTAVVEPNEVLTNERADEYFGGELSETDYRIHAVSNVARLILKDDDEQSYCVPIVPDFVKSGLQTIEIGQRAMPQAEAAPSYLQFMNAFGGVQ